MNAPDECEEDKPWVRCPVQMLWWVTIVCYVILLIAGLSFNLFSSSSDDCPDDAARAAAPAVVTASVFAGLLWAVAWTAIGALAGFLFSIPPSLAASAKQAAKSGNGDSADKSNNNGQGLLGVNTNLEQISDWLTKIIVGVGLVNLNKLPGKLDIIASYMSNPPCAIDCKPLAMAIILLFTTLGFLMGYLWMRLHIAPLIAAADHQSTTGLAENTVQVLKKSARESLEAGISGTGGVDEQPSREARDVTKQVLKKVPHNATGYAMVFVRALANLVAKKFNAAADDFAALISQKPDDVTLRLNYAWALHKSQGGFNEQIEEQLQAARRIGATPGSSLYRLLYDSLTYYYLFADPPKGFKQVIEDAENYFAKAQSRPSADVELNYACALGQQFSFEFLRASTPASPEAKGLVEKERQEAAAKAWKHVDKALTLNPSPSYRKRIAYLVTSANHEDLAPFESELHFAKLLAPDAKT